MNDDFTAADVPDQTGRTILVTGANTGIGFAATKALAARGARVLLGCRSVDKADRAIEAIRSELGDVDLDVVELDQADLAGVRRAAEQVADEPRLDVLVNNAGIMMPPRELTADGFESQFGVNHLGTFALTSLLLPKLAETAATTDGEPADTRVVVTSSIAHRGAKIFFDDLAAERSYRAKDRYGQSKLANLMFAFELDRRLRAAGRPTIGVACHPGIAETELTRHLPTPVRFLAPALRFFFNSADEGAWPTLMAATDPSVEGGAYVGPTRRGETAGPAGPAEATDVARDDALAAGLWEISIEMTGIDPGI